MRVLYTEMTRAFTEKSFLFTIGVVTLILMVSLFNYGYGMDDPDGFGGWLAAQSGLLLLIAPIAAVFPFADSYLKDEESRYIHFISFRERKIKYFFAKYLSNGMVGGAVLALPLLITLVISNMVFPTIAGEVPNEIFNVSGMLGYILWIILLDFVFGFAYATMGLAISFFTKKKYIVLSAPMVIYLLSIYSFIYLNLMAYHPVLTYSPFAIYGAKTTAGILFGQLFLIMGLSSIIIAIGANLKSRKW